MGGWSAVIGKLNVGLRTLGTTAKAAMSVALKPLLIMLAAVTAYEVISFAFKTTGSEEVTNAIDVIDRQLAKLDKRSVSTVDLKGYVETNNGFLNFLDKASRDVDNLLKKLGPLGDLMSMVSLPTAIGNLQGRNLLPTFGDVEFDRTSKQIEELQKKAGEIISGSSQVTDPLAMGGLIEQLDSFDRQIATTQSRIAALRSGDAKANAGQIEALGQELKSLNEQRSELLKQFDAVGQNAREQTRDALVGVRDERKAQLDSLDPKQQPQKVAQLKQEIAGLDKQIGQLNGQIKTYDQYMQELGNTLSRQRLTFINLSAAIAQMNQNFEIGISEQKASLITNQIERGLQTQVDELENLQFAVFEQSEMMRQLQIEFAAQQNYLASDAIAPGDRALVEEIIGKPLTDASMQDITELRMRLENDQNIKGKFGDEILGVIERMVNIKTELSKAEVGLAEANKALEQFELTRKDYIRDTARQFIDLSRQIQAQKIQDQRAVEDLQFTIIDTSIQMQRQTRQIQSAYNDMATELNIQLATAEKTLRDTQDKVAINQMRAANIAIAPGNSDSVARQIDNILLQFVEQSLNLDANERQIKIDVLNLERERTGLLRRIRELEEANADAIRNHERQLRDLGRQVQDLTRQFEDSALQMKRATEDLVESIRRSDITSEVGRMLMGMAQGLTGSYNPQAVAFSGYSGALPPPPPGGYGILPGGIVNQSYQRQLVQPNFSYADPWNPTPAEAARFGGAQSYQPDFDPIAVRDANRAYLNEAPRRQAGDLGILQDAMNNNQSGRSLTAPAQPQYQPMQSMGYRSMNDYGYRSMGQRPASVTPTQIIAPAPVYNQPQSSTRTGLGLPPGYQSLQGLANQYLVNHPMFAPTTRDGASALVLALGIGGTEAFGRGTQRTDWFTRMGGTGNNMKGFAQYNQVYHARNTANPQSYLNTLGGTLHGQTRTPNSARKFDFAGNLTSQVLGGRVNTGSDLIRFMQGTGLGGSNWQGVSDGWKRVPGLADTLVDYLKNTIPNLQSKLNFGIPESIELGQTAQAIDPRQAQPLIDLSRPLLGIFDTIDRNSGSRQTPGFINSFDRLIIKPLQDIFKDEKLGTVNQGIRKLQSDMELWDKPPGYVAPGTGKDVSPPPIEYTPVNPNQFRPTGFNANDPQFTQVYQREMAMPNVGQFTMPQMPAAPPMLNYDPLKNLVQEIDSINKQIIAARSDENASSFLMSQRQALDSILSLTRGLMDANRKNTQSYMDSALAINNMRTNVKGYQTILESALQTGADNYMQYEQQKRSIQDQRIAIERQLESRETIKANAANMLAMSKNLTGEQRAQLETAVGQADQQLAQLSLHYEYLGVQEQQLNNMQRQASFNAQNLAFEQMRLQAIDGFTSKMGELATLQYEMGGQLINTSGIMQAQAAMVGLEARAKSEAMALKLNTEETSKFVEMRQQIAELNLAKAYRDAVPFVGELTAGMRDMLLEAKSFGEVISGVLKNMATQIFDLLVGKPIQNWLSQNVVSIFGLDQVSENMPEFYGMGTGLLVDSAAASSPYFRQGMTDPTMYGAPMQAPPILESFTGAVDTVAGGLTEVSGQLPNFTSSIVENTIQTAQSVVTEQTALMTFIGALNAATLALVQFTASMGMNTATTAAGGLFNTFTGGGGGILGAIAGGFTGNTVQLPAFAQGIDDVMTQERLQSGKSPLLAVLHQGEAVLSTLNGDAQLYRALKRSGDWEQFKAKSPERYALGSDNIGGPSVSPGRSGGTGGGVTVVQNWTVKTNDADSFKRSQKQMDAEAAARYRRTMRGG
jgi:hypothetical protein